MGEAIWANIEFRTPKGWGESNPLVDGLSEALINGESQIQNDEQADDHFEWRINGEGNYGLNDGDVEFWLDWMRKHRVPFIASDEPKYEFEGIAIVNDGSHEWSGQVSSEQAVLSKPAYVEILAGTSQFRTVEEFFTILNTNSCRDFPIDHLPEMFPSDDLDNEDDDDDEVVFSVPVPGIGSTVFLYGDDDTLRGTRADLLLLARNIHDTLEGHDHDHP